MSKSILFSVIIPSYNRADLIAATLDSVFEQRWFHFEVIVVNDGSTDNTADIVAPYLADARLRYYEIQNSERGAARNFGVSKSKGDYITFLDSDDLFLPWHLQVAAQKIKETRDIPVFHLAYEMLHPDGRVDKNQALPSPVNNKLLEGNFLSCIGVFLRRDVILENKFDEDRSLSGSEDYELWMRIASRMPIITFPEITSRLINHEMRSVIQVKPEKLFERISILEKKLNADAKFNQAFGKNLGKFNSYRTLYLSLHLALSGERWQAFKSLIHTVREYPNVVFNYRFIVALKKIILG
ncbi:MAG TPA: glycosyltransferase family A protein [Cyclobacteriaceae bacterium]